MSSAGKCIMYTRYFRVYILEYIPRVSLRDGPPRQSGRAAQSRAEQSSAAHDDRPEGDCAAQRDGEGRKGIPCGMVRHAHQRRVPRS